ncbi:MAG: SLC13 family permease [Candidatus Helarchaeota archaeon]
MAVELFYIELAIIVVFFCVIFLIIFEKNRALISLIGAFFIVFIVLFWHSSIPSSITIDFTEFVGSNLNILTLIVGLMLLVEIFIESGVFEFIALKMIKISKGSPSKIFLIFIFLTYGMSIIMANVGAILIIVPLTITTCRILKIEKALPFFIVGEQISTVCSGIVLPISSIPNIIISTHLDFSFVDFLLFTAPFSLIILIFLIFFLKWRYLNKEDRLKEPPENLKKYVQDFDESSIIINRRFFNVSMISLFLLIFLIIAFQAYAHIVVMICILFLLIFSKLEVEKILKKVDWNTIFFLISLFIIIDTMKEFGILDCIASFILTISGGNLFIGSFLILWICGFTSGVVDNIPITLTLVAPINHILTSQNATLSQIKIVSTSLVIGASLGGCFTPIGSPSGVLTLQLAKEKGIKELNFKFYFKIGFLVTLINFAIASVYIYVLSFFIL